VKVLVRARIVRCCPVGKRMGMRDTGLPETSLPELARRFLAWGVAATLLLPMVIAIVLGLGGLLSALGDQAAAAACGRVGLVGGVVWFLAVAVTATVSGIVALDGSATRRDRPASPPQDHSVAP
jgi:hypothetical protein